MSEGTPVVHTDTCRQNIYMVISLKEWKFWWRCLPILSSLMWVCSEWWVVLLYVLVFVYMLWCEERIHPLYSCVYLSCSYQLRTSRSVLCFRYSQRLAWQTEHVLGSMSSGENPDLPRWGACSNHRPANHRPEITRKFSSRRLCLQSACSFHPTSDALAFEISTQRYRFCYGMHTCQLWYPYMSRHFSLICAPLSLPL